MTVSTTVSMTVSTRRGGGGGGGVVRRGSVVRAGTTNHHHQPPQQQLEKVSSRRRRTVLLMTTPTLLMTTLGATSAKASTVTSSLGVPELTRRGMSKFSGGEVEASVEDFDAVIRLDARYASYMWQRGLSLYYAGEYEEAAKQFRADVRVNPNDTEESVWCFASEAMDPNKGLEYARKNQLVTGRDSRRVMASVYALFSGAEDGEEALRRAGERNSSDEFYSALYLGLWYEINGRTEDAKREIKRANDTLYSRLSGDYMTDVARVHAQRRGW